MENYFPFHNVSDLENMMINILNEGKEKTWSYIEEETNALKRCEQRKIYWTAIKKLNEGK